MEVLEVKLFFKTQLNQKKKKTQRCSKRHYQEEFLWWL